MRPTDWFALVVVLCSALASCGVEDCDWEANHIDDDVYPIRENQVLKGVPIVDGSVTVEGDLATLELELEGGGRYRVVYRITDEFVPGQL